MRIILVNKYFYPRGGAEQSFLQTAELLKKNGHRVSFFSMRHPRNLPCEYARFFVSNVDYENTTLVSSICSAGRMLYSFEARRNIEELIKKEKPDIAHLNNIYHQLSPSLIHSLKKYGIPIVMTLRDYKLVCASYSLLSKGRVCELCKDGKYFNCFLQGCVKGSRIKSLLNTVEMYLHHKFLHIYDMVNVFISPSQFLRDKVLEMGFKARIEYLPNFVQVDEFEPHYDFQENSICYIGRLSQEKGLSTLLKAMQKLPKIRLKLIGEGPLREKLQKEAKDLGLSNVDFLGYKAPDELKVEVAKAMFVVLPSQWYENNPRSIIEGFALGKPAVASRIGGIPELVKDNVTGFTFEPGNAEDLALKIKTLAEDREGIKEMGKNCREFVEDKLNPKEYYQGLVKIYNQAKKG